VLAGGLLLWDRTLGCTDVLMPCRLSSHPPRMGTSSTRRSFEASCVGIRCVRRGTAFVVSPRKDCDSTATFRRCSGHVHVHVSLRHLCCFPHAKNRCGSCFGGQQHDVVMPFLHVSAAFTPPGHVVSAILSHTLCNYMGLPDISFMWNPHATHRPFRQSTLYPSFSRVFCAVRLTRRGRAIECSVDCVVCLGHAWVWVGPIPAHSTSSVRWLRVLARRVVMSTMYHILHRTRPTGLHVVVACISAAEGHTDNDRTQGGESLPRRRVGDMGQHVSLQTIVVSTIWVHAALPNSFTVQRVRRVKTLITTTQYYVPVWQHSTPGARQRRNTMQQSSLHYRAWNWITGNSNTDVSVRMARAPSVQRTYCGWSGLCRGCAHRSFGIELDHAL